jgi:hypothetical protein
MRKLLLLTNCLLLCVLLSTCQTPTSKSTESNSPVLQTANSTDTIAESKVVIPQDTSKTKNNTATQSDKQTTNANSTNSSPQKTKTTEIKRIEHGSSNQAKLDSIKQAKAKLKK